MLVQDRVGARLERGGVERGVSVAGQDDQAERRVFTPEPRHRRHAVEARHVQVDDRRVDLVRLRELDRADPVVRRGDDRQLGLAVDQLPQ